MRRLALALLLGCSSASATSAEPSALVATVTSDSGSTQIEVLAPSNPVSHGVVEVTLTLTDAKTHAALTGATIGVTPWMAAHGHGTSVAPTISELGQGRYRAASVDFYMPGSWQLQMTIGSPSSPAVEHATATLDVL